jgi:hypothetical protein
MKDERALPLSLSVHPVYGAIYQDGEFVQRGAVLGLSVDSRGVVLAPVSGWVRLPADRADAPGIAVEIWQKLNEGSDAPRRPGARS